MESEIRRSAGHLKCAIVSHSAAFGSDACASIPTGIRSRNDASICAIREGVAVSRKASRSSLNALSTEGTSVAAISCSRTGCSGFEKYALQRPSDTAWRPRANVFSRAPWMATRWQRVEPRLILAHRRCARAFRSVRTAIADRRPWHRARVGWPTRPARRDLAAAYHDEQRTSAAVNHASARRDFQSPRVRLLKPYCLAIHHASPPFQGGMLWPDRDTPMSTHLNRAYPVVSQALYR